MIKYDFLFLLSMVEDGAIAIGGFTFDLLMYYILFMSLESNCRFFVAVKKSERPIISQATNVRTLHSNNINNIVTTQN